MCIYIPTYMSMYVRLVLKRAGHHTPYIHLVTELADTRVIV